jgi:hypothetical protein
MTDARLAVLEAEFKGFKEKVSEQIADLRKFLVWALSLGLGGIIGLWGGVAVVYSQVSDLRTKVEVIEERSSETLQTLKIMQMSLSQLQLDFATLKAQSRNIAGGTDTKGTLSIPLLNDGDRTFIQKNMPTSVDKMLSTASQLKIGDVVPEPTALNPVPDVIVQRVPQLQGLKFGLGNNVIVLVGTPENRVVAIIARP